METAINMVTPARTLKNLLKRNLMAFRPILQYNTSVIVVENMQRRATVVAASISVQKNAKRRRGLPIDWNARLRYESSELRRICVTCKISVCYYQAV